MSKQPKRNANPIIVYHLDDKTMEHHHFEVPDGIPMTVFEIDPNSLLNKELKLGKRYPVSVHSHI